MRRVSIEEVPEEGVSHDPAIRKQVLLRKGELPHLTNFSRARLLPGQAARAHRHPDMSEVFFVARGVGVLSVEGAEQRLEAGVCVAVEAGEEHEVRNTGDAELVLYYFGVEA
jgi:quercetin dioxygenase-like cupin family protein